MYMYDKQNNNNVRHISSSFSIPMVFIYSPCTLLILRLKNSFIFHHEITKYFSTGFAFQFQLHTSLRWKMMSSKKFNFSAKIHEWDCTYALVENCWNIEEMHEKIVCMNNLMKISSFYNKRKCWCIFIHLQIILVIFAFNDAVKMTIWALHLFW